MATSGVYNFNPEHSDLLREAFERVLIKPEHITYDRIESAFRSANLLLQEWSNLGFKAYEQFLVEQTVSQGVATFSLPASCLRVFTAFLVRDGRSTPMVPISREDYESIPNKISQGRPTEFFLEPGKVGITQRTVTMWPVPENSSDVVRMWCLRRPETSDALAQEPGIAVEWLDAYVAGLAVRLAGKFNPKMRGELKAEYDEAWRIARNADRDRSPLRLRMSTRGRRGWR